MCHMYDKCKTVYGRSCECCKGRITHSCTIGYTAVRSKGYEFVQMNYKEIHISASEKKKQFNMKEVRKFVTTVISLHFISIHTISTVLNFAEFRKSVLEHTI
jgi:hypothetical protein